VEWIDGQLQGQSFLHNGLSLHQGYEKRGIESVGCVKATIAFGIHNNFLVLVTKSPQQLWLCLDNTISQIEGLQTRLPFLNISLLQNTYSIGHSHEKFHKNWCGLSIVVIVTSTGNYSSIFSGLVDFDKHLKLIG